MCSSPWLTSTMSLPAAIDFVQQRHPALLQSWLQKIFEEFLAEQVQAVAAHSAQHGMQQPRGEYPIRHVKKRPRQR